MTIKKSRRSHVKWFNAKKGFGFIRDENGGQDLFAHFENIQQQGDEYRTLEDDEEVEFIQIKTSKGPQAVEIRRVEIHGDGNMEELEEDPADTLDVEEDLEESH